MVGRFYAMDRDKHWERVKEAWDVIVHGTPAATADPVAAIEASYAAGVTDEFIRPLSFDAGDAARGMGDGNYGWIRQDIGVDYAGTWGIGGQLKDMSFVQDLKHTFRLAYWGGTNSTSMVKYMRNAYAWSEGASAGTVPYLTTKDGLVEFNLVNSYKIYENLEMNLELDYLVNCMTVRVTRTDVSLMSLERIALSPRRARARPSGRAAPPMLWM